MVCFKTDPLEDVKDPHWYYMSQELTENYYTQLHEDLRQLQEYIYDPVSEAYNLRKLLVELSVLCFSKLILKKEVVVPYFYECKFNEPHDYMVSSFTDLVTSCVDQLTNVNLKQKLTTGFLQPGLLASFILDTTETLIAYQNWNSSAAYVGMAIYNIALLIAECQRGGDFRNYVSNCLYASKLTGGSYGSHDNVYAENMANSLCDTEDGGFDLYLEHDTFQTENHGKVIANLMDKISGVQPHTQHQNPPFQLGEIGVSNIMVCMF